MPAVTLTKTEGLSIGALPLPVGWTIDVSSHVVPCCVRPAPPNGSQGPTQAAFYEGSMNVLRCESCDHLGDTIYFTEYFRPRLYDQSSRSAARTLGEEDMQKVLQVMPPCRPDRLPLLARTEEITDDLVPALAPSQQPRLPFSTLLDAASNSDAAAPASAASAPECAATAAGLDEQQDRMIRTPIDCIAARLLPSFHVFIQVVLDTADGASREAESTAEAILQEAKRRYVQPLLELPHLRAVADPHAALDQPDQDGPAGARHLDRTATEEEMTTLALRQVCSPLTLAERGMPSMGIFAKSARTVMSFRRLYTTRLTASVRRSDGSRRDQVERVDISLFHTHWNVGRQHGRSLDGSTTTTSTEALRQLVTHGLKLSSEDLVMEIPLRMLERERTTEAMRHPIALATLPVAQHPLFSLYNYRSIEAILEAHVAARSLVTRQGWTLEPVSFLKHATRFVPSAAFVAAVESQCADTVIGEAPHSALSGRDDINHAWCTGLHAAGRVPARCTFYLLEPPKTGAADEAKTAVGYVIGLIAPRVQSAVALLVITPLHPLEPLTWRASTAAALQGVKDGGDAAVRAREALVRATCNFMIDEMLVTAPTASEWGSLCKPTPDTVPGAVFQQGELLLEVPAGDARYRNAVVVPTAAYYFTSRGSLTVYAQPSVSFTFLSSSSLPGATEEHGAVSSATTSCATSPLLSPSTAGPATASVSAERLPPFACLSAVWTVVADGRSAAEYIDYAISEYQYDLDVKNLGNVGARSHLDRPGVLVVRQRKLQPPHTARTHCLTNIATSARPVAGSNRTSAATAATAAKGMGETWSVWLDIGTTKRLLLFVSERGLGQLVVTQATLPAVMAAGPAATVAGTVAALAPEQEERMLEEWVRDVPVAVLPRL